MPLPVGIKYTCDWSTNWLIDWLAGARVYLDVYGTGDDAVDGRLGERVELAVFATHEVRLEDVAAAAVVLERPEIQLHRQVCITPSRTRTRTT